MAMTIKEQKALELDDRKRSVEEIRKQRLAHLALKKLTAEQAQVAIDAIERDRPVYEALRDR